MPYIPADSLDDAANFFRSVLPDVAIEKVSAMWLTFTIGHMISVDLSRIAGQYDLSLADIHFLGSIRVESRGPIRARDVATILDVSPAALSPRIKRLEKRNYLKRNKKTGDKRAYIIKLTDLGKEIVDKFIESISSNSLFVRALNKIDDNKIDELRGTLSLLHDFLHKNLMSGVVSDRESAPIAAISGKQD